MRPLTLALSTALVVAFGQQAVAQAPLPTEANAYFVDAIPGTGVPPVDIAIDGVCAFEDLTFVDNPSAETVPLAVSPEEPSHEFDFFFGDGAPDATTACTGPFLRRYEFGFGLLETPVLVGQLDASGTSGLSKVTTNSLPVNAGKVRITVYHTAAAPAVDMRIRLAGTKFDAASAVGLRNGDQSFPVELDAGTYRVFVSPSSVAARFQRAVYSEAFRMTGGFAYALFVGGSVADGSLDIVPLAIDTLGP